MSNMNSMNPDISYEDIRELKEQMTRLSQKLETMIRLEERQTDQGRRIGDIEKDLAALATRADIHERDDAAWKNRGVGIWLLAAALFGVYQVYLSHPALLK